MGVFAGAFETLFREAFEGRAEGADGTMFVEGHEGFFDAMDTLTAEEASRKLSPSVSSIAAHTNHTAYYIHLANQWLRGNREPGDWEGSWKHQTVTETEWDGIRAYLRKEVSDLLEWVRAHSEDNAEHYLGGLAQCAHAGFHLGAVRQLYRWVKDSTPA